MTLRDVCSDGGLIQTGPFGSQLHASDYLADGVPVVMPTNIGVNRIDEGGIARVSEEMAQVMGRHRLRSGDIVYSRRGDITRRALVREEVGWLCGTGCLLVRPGAGTDSDWLSFWLGTPKTHAWLLQHSVGATMPNLNTGILAALPVSLPPLDEQRRVADVLGALDDLIYTNECQIRSIKELTTQLYRATIAVSEENEHAFYEIFDVEFGGAFRGENFTKSGVGMPLLRIRDFKQGVSEVWTTERLPGDTIVKAGDIVVGMDAEFRPTQWVGEHSLLNQRVCRVSAKNGSNAFALEALAVPMAYIEGHKTGTTVIHLNKRDLEETKVTIPSDSAIQKFDDVAEPLWAHSIGLSQENKTLRRTRDELLPVLMSGAVRVRPEGVSR